MAPVAATVTISTKHQIVIPQAARLALNIKPRQQLVVIADSFGVRLVPKRSLSAYAGLGKETWRALGGGEKYLKQERASWDAYERKIKRLRRGNRARCSA